MSDAFAPTLRQQKPFVRFWMARVTGILSNQMLMLAVAWQMYDLTSSAWDLGLVGLFQFIPALLMTLPAGHLADRLHRARIFAACMATQAAVALVLLGAISLDLFAVLLGGATALLPIYARDILHTGPQGLGLLRAAPAVGALLMTLVLVRFPLQRHAGYKLLGAVGVFGLATLVFGVSTHFGLSMLALAVTGAADSISVVTRQTLMQLDTPDEMRGRVSAVNSIFIGASNQLGEFESGATAALWGPVGSVVVGGLGTLVIALAWLKLFPELAKRDRLFA